jgi:Methyltransferase FkbM domain
MKRDERKRRFAKEILERVTRPLGFIDVGSGGPLKTPWSLLPPDGLKKYDIDPETQQDGGMPTCISDHNGAARFNIAVDPRSSSLHEPSEAFIARHGAPDIRTSRVIDVNVRRLSDVFGDLRGAIDMMDVNVEGHDGHVLRGADVVFSNNFIKLVKVEYELTEVWHGQSWFGDIDSTMRGYGYDLAQMVTENNQPSLAVGLRVGAEPIWGKAIYVPGAAAWMGRARSSAPGMFRDECLAGICLYVLFDLPARALEVAKLAESLRSANAAFQTVPAASRLFEELRSVHGSVPLAARAAKRAWRYLPIQVRKKLRGAP